MKRAGTAALAGLCLATTAYSVLQSLIVPALGVFQHELNATPAATAWLLTAFLLSASISTPILGRLADIHGKRRILIAALTAMSAGALTSALATGLPLMIAGRAVQGLGGAVFPLCFALIRDVVPPGARPRAFVVNSTVMSVGGAAGTISAGPILAVLSSSWLFLIPALVSALAIIPVVKLLPPGTKAQINTKIDWYGAALLATWLGLLLLSLSRFGSPGWAWPLAAATLLFPLWWRSQQPAATTSRAPHPPASDSLPSRPSLGDVLPSRPASGDVLPSPPASGDFLLPRPPSGDSPPFRPSLGDVLSSRPVSGDSLLPRPSLGDSPSFRPSPGDSRLFRPRGRRFAAGWTRLWRGAEQPLIDLRTLALPTVRATNAATLLLGFGMFGSWMVIPLLVADEFDAGPAVVGLVMVPTAVGNLLVMRVYRRLTARQGPRAALATGIATAGIAYLGLALAHQTLTRVCLGILLMGAGIGLAFAAVGALVVEAVPTEQTAVSAAINTVMRTVGGSFGTAVGGAVLTWTPSYTTVLLLYAAALAGALCCAVRVPRPVTAPGEPAEVRTGTA